MRAVAVVGGRGFFGRGIVAALAGVDGVEVRTAGYSLENDRVVDLNEPTTLLAIDDLDVVVSSADSLAAPPDALFDWALGREALLVDTAADPATIERLLARGRAHPAPRGVVLLGMGIFPGLSNVLAGSLARRAGARRSLEVLVALDVLSGAGAGMCALMVELMRHAPVTAGPAIELGGETLATVRIGLPEARMLRDSTGVAATDVLLAPRPSQLAHLLPLVARPLRWPRLVAAPWARTLRSALTTVRTQTLAGRKARITLAAWADCDDGTAPPDALFEAADGARAGGHAVAAALSLLLAGPRPQPGVYLPDQLLAIEPLVAEMRRLGCGGLTLRP